MIRKAVIRDLDSIMKILAKIIEEMHAVHNYQWDENYPQAKDFTADIQREELYVSVREDKVVGFICINKDEPKEYDGLNWSRKEEAFVIHRMGVSTDCRNAGIGTELVKFADKVCQKNHAVYLKTDTYSLNIKVQRLFQKCNFTYVGEMRFNGKENPFYCYEKVLG